MNWDEMVLVGRIARPQGHRGQVVVNPATDFPDERFAAGAVLHTLREGRVERLTVVAMRLHQGRPVLTLEDVGTMNEAQALAGLELRVPETELAVLPEGTYYEHDLVGCVLVTRDGRELGTVRAVEGGGGTTRLVAGSGRGEIQVPLVHDICVRIDIEEKRIVVEPPEGLLDLNA
ncbi:MAG TPA: ribosome maturation factor RimM [Vicinamibacterales bacterium]|nr:ribosome maturation factor RimM [Vicinamibacterales bacterium]